MRTVVKANSSSYQHRRSLVHYQAVAHYIDEHATDGVTTSEFWDGLPKVPRTQAADFAGRPILSEEIHRFSLPRKNSPVNLRTDFDASPFVG